MSVNVQQKFFLNVVRDGPGYVGFRNKAGDYFQRYCTSNESMLVLAQGVSEECDVWFSMATFPDHKATREAKNASKLCSLWFDIDAHDGSKYQSPEEAKAAVDQFLTMTELPQPTVVHWTGYGIHAIWAFSSALPVPDWMPIAQKLQTLAQTLKLGIDPITADAARILRMPGTINFRNPANLKPTRIDAIRPLADLDDFETRLNAAIERYPSVAPERPTKSGNKGDFNAEPTEKNIQLVKAMLSCIDPDPYPDAGGNRAGWMRVIWALASTGWNEIAYKLALDWSMAGDLFDQTDFDGVWDSYDASWGERS